MQTPPSCPKCALAMDLIAVTPRLGLPDLRTYECVDCGVEYAELNTGSGLSERVIALNFDAGSQSAKQ